MNFDFKFWLMAGLAAYFFYQWNKAEFCQTLAMPLVVAGWEQRTGKRAPAQIRQLAGEVEQKFYAGTDGGRMFGLEEKPCGCHG